LPADTSITFHSELESYSFTNEKEITHWLYTILEKEHKEISQVNYVFVSDEALLELNKEYLDHHDFTDILSFQLEENPIEGDIFISIDRVKENAVTYGVSTENELLRVIAHGMLHFIGYKDKTEEEADLMRLKEEECLTLVAQFIK
jgi:rRNA maturation RNase YbeY